MSDKTVTLTEDQWDSVVMALDFMAVGDEDASKVHIEVLRQLDPETYKKGVITRTYHGASEDVSFEDFAQWVIQDWDVAEEIVNKMLAGDTPYQYGEDESIYYEEFVINDEDGLRQQMEDYKRNHVVREEQH